MDHLTMRELKTHKRNHGTSSSITALVDHDVPASPRYVYTRQNRPWSSILLPYRVGIRLVTTCLALAVAGMVGYIIMIRNSTKGSSYLDANGRNRMAWPRAVWMQPTILLLSAAGVSFLFDLISLIMSCAEAQRSGVITVCLGSVSFVSCIAAWVVALVYAKTWTNSEPHTSDLWSWSCRHTDIDLNYGNESLSFGTLCNYMNFVFGGGIAAATLQLINLVTFFIVQKSNGDQKKIAKRNTYVRKFLLGKPDEDGLGE